MPDQFQAVLDRTASRCHLCRKRLYRKNYGRFGARGAWEIDHLTPRACGGTDHGNNLLAACISCNRSKQAGSSREIRAANGIVRPLSVAGRARIREENTTTGAAFLGLAGLLLLGPAGALLFGLTGALIGHSTEPE